MAHDGNVPATLDAGSPMAKTRGFESHPPCIFWRATHAKPNDNVRRLRQ